MVLKGKRAEGIISFLFAALFSLILAAFFFVAVFMRVTSAVKDSSFHKRFYARDLALLTDSMHASNGEMIVAYEFSYPEKMSLEASLNPDRVSIADSGRSVMGKKAPTSFLFGHNERIIITNSVITPKPGLIFFDMTLKDNNLGFYSGVKEDIELEEDANPK